MNEYRVKQIKPNRASHISHWRTNIIDNMCANELVIAQPKYDGMRFLIHIDGDNVYCTSRTTSVKTNRFTENQDKVPALVNAIRNSNFSLGYTILDCELYCKDWSTMNSVMQSLPERAIELQKTEQVRYAVFDCLFYDGIDVRDEQYILRLQKMSKVIDQINFEFLHSTEFITDDGIGKISDASFFTDLTMIEKLFDRTVDAGYEGIVVKSLTRSYDDKASSLKVKKFETVDCVVCDYTKGNGKYSDTIGALIIGYYDPEKDDFVRISRVNCSTDEMRNYWYQNWSKMRHSVIEVKCQELTDKSLKHPVFVRLRDDKTYQMCTRDTIFKSDLGGITCGR